MREPWLIQNLTVALGAGLVAGFIVARLGLPPLVGYLLAGVAVGPATPGPVADQALAAQLAEVGIILLMFGVGVQFSIRELVPVWRLAVAATVVQTAVLTLAGLGLGRLWGWDAGAGVLLGFAASIASTVVGLRALVDRNLLDSTPGRIVVGWLIVEDVLTVLVLLVVPSLAVGPAAEGGPWLQGVAVALGKGLIFGILMLFVGTRVVPWLLIRVARTGSRELFVLAVLAVALGTAFLSHAIFGLSLALGAFVAGLVVSESDVSHHAAAESLPLRDAFAVLFFVSAGMLFDPGFLVTNPVPVATLLGLIVVVKPLIALATVVGFGHALRTALTVAAARAQVGEFSFLLGTLGLSLGLFSSREYNLIVVTTLLSVALNPVLFRVADLAERWAAARGLLLTGRAFKLGPGDGLAGSDPDGLRGHVIVCGYGRVGRVIVRALSRRGFPFVVVDQDRRLVEALRRQGIRAVYGDAGRPLSLEVAGVARARVVVVATSDPVVARRVVDYARKVNPRVGIVVRTHSGTERVVLERLGADEVVLAELGVALEMVRHILRRFGVSPLEVQAFVQGLRSSFGYPSEAETLGGEA